VYKTDIDAQQQKVVVIGNVSAAELVKKLLKTGKHAEQGAAARRKRKRAKARTPRTVSLPSRRLRRRMAAVPAHRTMRERAMRGAMASLTSLMKAAAVNLARLLLSP
jgi:hypothetical protein